MTAQRRGLHGRVTLVTGGTRGIGSAICKRLADSGARVATNYRDRDGALAWQREGKAAGYDFTIVEADVTDFAACKRMVEEVERELGPVEILVNNAGITKDAPLHKMTAEQWGDVVKANLDGVFNVTRHVVAGMRERGYGRIINISSINGQKGQFGQTNYAASKAGMHGFTMALAQEMARKGVTVNTVSPGYIATDMVLAIAEEIRGQIIAEIPVARLGTPEEVAHVVDFLASDEAGFITGTNVACNGGQHMM